MFTIITFCENWLEAFGNVVLWERGETKFLFSSNFSLICFLVRSLRQLKAVVPFVKRQRYAPITPALAMFLYVAVHIDLKWKTIEDYAVVCLKLLRGKRDIHH